MDAQLAVVEFRVCKYPRLTQPSGASFFLHLQQNKMKGIGMDSLEVKQWVNANKSKFPLMQIGLVATTLERMDENSFRAAISQSFKSPAVAFLLALFLPGIDQFYLGKIGAGILQIFLWNWLTFGIYPFVRLFKVCKEAKEVNVNKMTTII